MHDPERYRAYLDLVSGRRRGVRAAALRAMLRLASAPYAAAVCLRNVAFNHHLRRIARVEVPVISVGNLTTGGTGKTPLVEYVARRLRERGVRVAVLSRGYGAPAQEKVSGTFCAQHPRGLSGKRYLTPFPGNDETDLLARNLPDVPQLVDPDRVTSARIAIDELDVQCLVMDDGFQHRRLARDLDLVTIDALNPFGFGHLLPRGLLREPLRSLRRADVAVLTRCDQAADLDRLRARLTRVAPGVAVVESRHAPVGLVSTDGTVEDIDRLRGRRVLAVCGIGNPDAFKRTLAACGADVAGFLAFPDHHAYTAADRRAVHRAADDARADAVITTQKDLAKLACAGEGVRPPRRKGSDPFSASAPRATWAVRVQLEVTRGRDLLDARLREIAERVAH